jgi:hypothetical protein
MTVASQVSKVSYAGNGSTQNFAVPYYFLENGHLRVVLRSSAGVETVQTITTNYTVTGAGNPAGGQVSMVVAPPAGFSLVIVRNVPVTQETDYTANDPFPAESHERALDKLTMISQQSSEIDVRSIKIPETETNVTQVPTSSNRANKLLGFGAGGDVTVSSKTINAIEAAVTTIETLSTSVPGSSAAVSHIGLGSGAVPTTVQAKLREFISVKDFGAVGDGVADDTGACQAAVDYVTSIGGGTVYFPQGSYRLVGAAGLDGIVHGIHVPYTQPGIQAASISVRLVGAGKDTKLVAGTANMFIVRWSTSQGGISDLCFAGNGTSTGLALTAADTTSSVSPAGLSDVTHNSFNRLLFEFNREGIHLGCAPAAGSGVYYNVFDDIYIFFGQGPVANNGGRGILLKQYPGANGQQNRNFFTNITFKRLNTGIEINEGDSQFSGVDYEDITYGTLPNALATAIKIGAGCADVKCFNMYSEVSVVGFDNAGFQTEFFGCTLGVGANGFGGSSYNIYTAVPQTLIGGYFVSEIPLITPGLVYHGNNQVSGTLAGVYTIGGSLGAAVRVGSAFKQFWSSSQFGFINNNVAANPYAGKKYLSASSNFDNPTVNLITFLSAASGGVQFSVTIIKVTVHQAEYQAENGNVHVGYAKIMGDPTSTGAVVTMTVEQNLGTANVGTLSWSGKTLRYTANRVGNFDAYGITVEIGGALTPLTVETW